MGGMVLETNMTEILTRIEEQNKLEKQEVCLLKKYKQQRTVTKPMLDIHRKLFLCLLVCCNKHMLLNKRPMGLVVLFVALNHLP